MEQSVTSTDSFAGRAQNGEAARVALWIIVLTGMLVITVARRLAGGVVMSDGHVFYPYAGLLAAALAGNVVLLRVLRRANAAGRLLPQWLWRVSAVCDLAVAAGLLVIAAFLSPRGAVPALSSPALLLLPLIVLMSVLRLRPNFTLYTGLAAAAIHLLLAARALVVSGGPAANLPVYLAYGCILAMTAVVGWFVAREVKEHVREAADEAASAERVERQVIGMRHDLSVARDIQRGLLPTRPPKLAGFEITGMNRPADQTGGDYYDWQALPGGRLALVMADVSGHGIGPALVMAVCRAYARATAATCPDPTVLVTRMNQLLADDLPADRFITLAVAVLDADGTARLVSAGHGPTLLYRASTGEVVQFGGDGMPLGVSAGEEYGPVTPLTLDEGDVLVLLTDGFFEWARPGDDEAFGINRLQEALRASASRDAATILQSIDEAVIGFCAGSSQPDDMTAIVVKRTAPARVPDGEGELVGSGARVG